MLLTLNVNNQQVNYFLRIDYIVISPIIIEGISGTSGKAVTKNQNVLYFYKRTLDAARRN